MVSDNRLTVAVSRLCSPTVLVPTPRLQKLTPSRGSNSCEIHQKIIFLLKDRELKIPTWSAWNAIFRWWQFLSRELCITSIASLDTSESKRSLLEFNCSNCQLANRERAVILIARLLITLFSNSLERRVRCSEVCIGWCSSGASLTFVLNLWQLNNNKLFSGGELDNR